LRAAFFLAAALDLFFAAVLRFVLRFFFAFAVDFLRDFLAIGSPQIMQDCKHEIKRHPDLAPGLAATIVGIERGESPQSQFGNDTAYGFPPAPVLGPAWIAFAIAREYA
jgi:hypothetical protein